MFVPIALYVFEVLVLLAILRSDLLCRHEIVQLASELQTCLKSSLKFLKTHWHH